MDGQWCHKKINKNFCNVKKSNVTEIWKKKKNFNQTWHIREYRQKQFLKSVIKGTFLWGQNFILNNNYRVWMQCKFQTYKKNIKNNCII